jgi:predicted protein tyrosine phosphatase
MLVPPATICVCPLSKLPAETARLGASHVVTLIREHEPVPTPAGIPAPQHHRVGINDITIPSDGLIHPTDQHVRELLSFVRAWPRQAPMMVHCWAGISRSTAAAFITQCALDPDADPAALAWSLRAASPTATPNWLLVEIADGLLGRGGAMTSAILAIGSGEMAMEGVPFLLPVKAG